MTTPKIPNSAQALAALLGGGANSKSNRWGIVSVVAIGATLVLIALFAAPLIRLKQAVPASPPASKSADEALAKFDDSMTAYVAQVNGRHAFSKPLAKHAVIEPDQPLVKATRYDGPAIVAMVNSTVWFSDGQRLSVGQESKDGDLKVVALRAPWSARVAWRHGEFDVDFFQRSPLLTGKPGSWNSSPDDVTSSARSSPPKPADDKAIPVPGGLPGSPPPRSPDSPPPPPPAQGEPEPAPATPAPTPAPTAAPAPSPAPPVTPPSEPEKSPS